ncbi:MAG TPA: YgjP-like metallopeptidase domain-containing protein [Nitrososphaerales archaeon]|nr:YgjP-like metallopeptidase domain-containing protein [Nitrososphaerales archaeon]
MPHLEIGAKRIEYSIVKGASRRYTYFRFRPDLTLEVSVPKGRSLDVKMMIKERLSWIEREYTRAARTKRILSAEGVMFGGRYHRLIYIEDSREELVLDVGAGEVTVRACERQRVKELVRRWFLKETSNYVVRKVREFSPLLRTRPSRVDVREIAKWGYCTQSRRLSFSWQLIALPEKLREYVVLHELVHLIEFNHSATFGNRLASVCPDFRSREKELDTFVPYDRLALG